MLRSRSSCRLPEPRVTAPVSSTTAARPRSFRQARVCWSHAQSPRPLVTPSRGRKRSNGSSANRSGLNGWFHIGLATTTSWEAMRPAGVLNFGLSMVSPRAISISMSWMIAFMWATA